MVRVAAVLAFAVAVMASPVIFAADAQPQPEQMQQQQMDGDLLTIIQNEHRAVAQMLQDLMKKGDEENKRELVQKLGQALLPHMMAEEKLVYPALKAEGDDKIPVMEADEEHQMAKKVLLKLQDDAPDSDMFRVRVKILSDMITNHVQEEETVLFPMAKKLGDDDLKKLTQEFVQAKQEAKPEQILLEARQKMMEEMRPMMQQMREGRMDRGQNMGKRPQRGEEMGQMKAGDAIQGRPRRAPDAQGDMQMDQGQAEEQE